MKTPLSIFFVVPMLLLLFAACGEKKQIEQAAYGYLDAVSNYRFDDADAFVTPETRDVTLAFFKAMLQHTDTAFIASNTPATITLGSVMRPNDSTARVTYKKVSPIKEHSDTINLVKRDGQWLVDLVINVPPIVRMAADTAASPRPLPQQMPRPRKH